MPILQPAISSSSTYRESIGARTVCDIADIAFTDAIEIRQIIQALELQNRNEISEALLAVGAGYAADVIKNALIARLVLLVGRVFDGPGAILHVGRAVELMKDSAVRSEVETRGRRDLIVESLKRWSKLKDDPSLDRIRQLRDEYLTHSESSNGVIPHLKFPELFEFARNTTAFIDTLARATGTRTQCLDSWDEELNESALAFWQPWQGVHLVFERFRSNVDR